MAGPDKVSGGGLRPVSRGGEEEKTVIQAQKGLRVSLQNAKASAQLLLDEINGLEVSEAEIKFGLTTTGENEALGRKDGSANNLFGFGEIAVAQGDLDTARDYYQKALVLNEEMGRKHKIIECQEALARLDT